jgi:hypothetical protein
MEIIMGTMSMSMSMSLFVSVSMDTDTNRDMDMDVDIGADFSSFKYSRIYYTVQALIVTWYLIVLILI